MRWSGWSSPSAAPTAAADRREPSVGRRDATTLWAGKDDRPDPVPRRGEHHWGVTAEGRVRTDRRPGGAPGGATVPAGSEGSDLLEDGRLPVGSLVGVDDALGGGLVEQPAGHAGVLLRLRSVAGFGGLAEAANSRLEGRLHRLVAKPRSLVLAVALDLGLDVRHGAEPRSGVCGQYGKGGACTGE